MDYEKQVNLIVTRYVKNHRIKKGLTKEELAAKSYIPLSQLEEIERGDRDPEFVHLLQINAGLGYEYNQFLQKIEDEVMPLVKQDIKEGIKRRQ